HEAIPLAGSDASKKERSVFYRGVERTKHSEAPVKISQPFVHSLFDLVHSPISLLFLHFDRYEYAGGGCSRRDTETFSERMTVRCTRFLKHGVENYSSGFSIESVVVTAE
ncbi:MAG: hypothetical protein J6C40_12380, partial [Lentisphaeria bacterium]|nr:hypothetical protein [Lentisphaeria bacterium]